MDLDPDILRLGVAWYAIFVVSTSLHEAAHALAAWRLGDSTAYYGGQVTLNPVPHIAREPVGMIAVPILSFLMTGWMFGFASAPYDPSWAQRYPRRAAMMALAGPAANFGLMLLAAAVIRIGLSMDVFHNPQRVGFTTLTVAFEEGTATSVATLVSILFTLNLVLFVFNLLPVPPLDGSGALPLILPERMVDRYQNALRQPGFGMMGLILAWVVMGQIFPAIHLAAINLVYLGVASYG